MSFGREVAGAVEDQPSPCNDDHHEQHESDRRRTLIVPDAATTHLRNLSTTWVSLTVTVRSPGVQTPVSAWLETLQETVTVTVPPCHAVSYTHLRAHETDS